MAGEAEGRVTVLGSANRDLVIQVERLPRPGETVRGGGLQEFFGGKGANQAVAAARAGARVALLALLGGDPAGARYRRCLRSEGIESWGLGRVSSAPTGLALILVDRRGQNQIAVVPGANSLLTPDCLHALRGKRAWGRVLLVQLEIPLPTVERALKDARTSGALTVLNPAPAARLSPRVLRLVDFILPNEVEAEVLTGEHILSLREAKKACRKLLELGPRAAIITLGGRGVVYLSEDEEGSLAGHRVKGVDSTAAGDVFCGALAAALARGESLKEALGLANAAAALSVTRQGAQPSIPRLYEILGFLGKEDTRHKRAPSG